MDQIITYILASSIFPKIILCILAVIMISGIAKMIAKMTSLKSKDNIRRLLLSIFNIIIGGCMGLFIFGVGVVDFITGSVCGYFSSIIYRIVIKKLYDRFQINAVPPNEEE